MGTTEQVADVDLITLLAALASSVEILRSSRDHFAQPRCTRISNNAGAIIDGAFERASRRCLAISSYVRSSV
jgi:hypothetical protein